MLNKDNIKAKKALMGIMKGFTDKSNPKYELRYVFNDNGTLVATELVSLHVKGVQIMPLPITEAKKEGELTMVNTPYLENIWDGAGSIVINFNHGGWSNVKSPTDKKWDEITKTIVNIKVATGMTLQAVLSEVDTLLRKGTNKADSNVCIEDKNIQNTDGWYRRLENNKKFKRGR